LFAFKETEIGQIGHFWMDTQEVPMAPAPTDQCIVLPFRPSKQQPFDGTGLALHFLLGNVLVLHTGLKEMWFGWRVKKIFPEMDRFQAYCRDTSVKLDLAQASRSQKIRFWCYGDFTDRSVRLHFFDGQASDAGEAAVDLLISIDDGLVGFRSLFMDWLASSGRPMPAGQVQAALWEEKIDHHGLDAVGRALKAFYIYSAYGHGGSLNVAPFTKAVDLAPQSFMAQDLHGWALYRNQKYTAAKIAFLKSLRINPAGAGAMSGLMWCGVYAKDLEEAMYWSGRKADVCGRDVVAAREAGRRRYEKVNAPQGKKT
jgi:hypothetical protein